MAQEPASPVSEAAAAAASLVELAMEACEVSAAVPAALEVAAAEKEEEGWIRVWRVVGVAAAADEDV